MTTEEILNVNIPTGIPSVYEIDDTFKAVNHYCSGNQKLLKQKMAAVANQGKKK